MAMDPEIRTHQEWLGYLQPVGLVVSAPALISAQAFPNRNIIPDHARFLECVTEVPVVAKDDPVPAITNLPRLFREVLGWESTDLEGPDTLPSSLEVTLPEYNETLRPTYAVREFTNGSGAEPNWMMLIQQVSPGISLDDSSETEDHRWQATPQVRFERLLRETQVPIGVLSNGTQLRLVYAPRGETSGHLTFPVQAMTEVAGRQIFAALQMLLSAERLFTLPDKQRLPAILSESRKYQNLVSTKLSEQVLAALYELLRGFQAADHQRHGDLLREVLAQDPNQVYAGLLTVLMRLVFTLYAEDRGLLSNDEIYQKNYAVTGLFERLRADAGRHTDTMDHRYGAWPQLLTLFRLIHDGGRHGGMKLLARKGYLFDPDRYPFLEGRPHGSKRQPGERTEPPHVSDGVVFRVLQNLLILDGERLSYRTLDVEQIGSVYETMMGFNLEVARGRSIAIKPKKAHGAPTTINLEELLQAKPAERVKWLKQQTDQDVTGQAATALKAAETPEDAVAALEKRVAKAATPRIVPPGAMVLQPSDERRKSGSHYTPRSLTEPIVRTTFRPILERLGVSPKPEQILDLKVCDPAMGSGAFLVEACRQLGDELVKAWHAHDCLPVIPPDEDELLHARRIIAQRCLYGVDKNPMAVDLAKMSLWLATLAKEHPFTFLDHALRYGDSLVGLGKAQILGFHWKPEKQKDFARAAIEGQLNRAMEQRRQIREAPDGTSDALLRERLEAADGFLNQARRYGDLVISAFFAESNDRRRKERLEFLADHLVAQRSQYDVERHHRLERAVGDLRSGTHPITPFHWEIEFPEVFDRENPGFDAFVGNPPFAGKNTLTLGTREGFLDWLKQLHEDSHGNADLVAHFFRRAFAFLRTQGCFGLIATNTIYQGDTRSTGLKWICTHGGTIFAATKRLRWPGQAAVIVSTVNVCRGSNAAPFLLDGKQTDIITAYLFHTGGHDDPERLSVNESKSFQGPIVLGMGFTFDDNNDEATPLCEMDRILRLDEAYSKLVHPYIGGDELLDDPRHIPRRYVINFSQMSEDEARAWPELFSIVEAKVRPQRQTMRVADATARRRQEYWWQWGGNTPGLFNAILNTDRFLMHSFPSKYLAFAFIPSDVVVAAPHCVFAFSSYDAFAVLQSRIHEAWALFFASTQEDRLRYLISDCFVTFPFPRDFANNHGLEAAGRIYYEFRADLMVRINEGLTKTYNRFHGRDHDAEESDKEVVAGIQKLRELHAAMDKAVLEAYGWHDLAESTTCEFLLDYEEDEDDEDDGGGGRRRRRKKPWRYRWPDDFRDEVLARLLELNRQRAQEERLSGQSAEAKGSKKASNAQGKKANKVNPDQASFL